MPIMSTQLLYNNTTIIAYRLLETPSLSRYVIVVALTAAVRFTCALAAAFYKIMNSKYRANNKTYVFVNI